MISEKEHIKLERKFLKEYRELKYYHGKFLDHNEYGLYGELDQVLPLDYAVSSAEDYHQALMNKINHFRSYTLQLKAWNKLLDGLSDSKKHYYVTEFLEPIAMSLVNFPYALRNNFIYCTTMLLHEFGIRNEENFDWEIDKRRIKLSLLNKYEDLADRYDLKFEELFKRIAGLNRGKINDYRVQFSHRFPLNIEFGISTTMASSRSGDKILFGTSGYGPLKLSEIVNISESEFQRIKVCFYKYDNFVNHLFIERAKNG